MPTARNKFSSAILSSEPGEEVPGQTVEGKELQPKTPPSKPPENERVTRADTLEQTLKGRPDYRKTRASKEGKKYINILIDEELQSELKPRMVTRKLTWEKLVEGLLKQWLHENPGFKP